jgi:hypothetical protein
MNPVQTLLRHSIDYAGLFPPAGLGMDSAVQNYIRYRAGSDAWALGRFVVPAKRLAEFEGSVAKVSTPFPEHGPLQLSVLVGPDVAGDLGRIAAFQTRQVGPALMIVEMIESKAETLSVIQDTMSQVPDQLRVYFELPVELDPVDLLEGVSKLGAAAKVRTGGVTGEVFPTTESLARFIHRCVGAKVAFKATAGLHHALRAKYRLTYEENSAEYPMFGFLNLFLATALAREGVPEPYIRSVLEESSPDAFRVEDSAMTWRDWRLDQETLHRSRDSMVSFGSCSFTEPISELQSLQLLPPSVQHESNSRS